MHVFITGGSGWIGSAVTDELLTAGHRVSGLARSGTSATALERKGVRIRRGDLDDLDALHAGATAADAVLHLGFRHDFDDFAAAGRTERAAVQAFGDALAGTGKALLLASGVAGMGDGRALTERDPSPHVGPESPRGGSEALAMSFADRGVRPVALRFAVTVHGAGDHGFVAELVRVARERGASGYVGDGSNRWPAVHRSDAGRLARLALEQANAGTAVHLVAEDGIPTREIAEAIGSGLGLPTVSVPADRAVDHFGWIGRFFAADMPVSAAATRERFGWAPTGPTLAEDLATGSYFRD